MQEWMALLGSVVALVAPGVYIHSILKGRTKPHRTTWLVYSAVTSVTAASIFAGNGEGSLLLALAEAAQSLIVFTLAISRGVGGWSKADLVCWAVAMTALFAWVGTGEPRLALALVLLADLAGTLPTLAKAWRWPQSESGLFYGLDVAAGFLVLISVSRLAMVDLAYPAYILMVNLVMVMLIVGRTTGERHGLRS